MKVFRFLPVAILLSVLLLCFAGIYTSKTPPEMYRSLYKEQLLNPITFEEVYDLLEQTKEDNATDLQKTEAGPISYLQLSRVKWSGIVHNIKVSSSGRSIYVQVVLSEKKDYHNFYATFPRPHAEELMRIHKGDPITVTGEVSDIYPPLVTGYSVFLRDCELVTGDN